MDSMDIPVQHGLLSFMKKVVVVCLILECIIWLHLTGLLGPAKSVMAMLSIVNPERTVDDKGKIKVEAEDNAHVLLEHDKGVIISCDVRFQLF